MLDISIQICYNEIRKAEKGGRMKRNEKAELSGILSVTLLFAACWGIWTRFIPAEINNIAPLKMPYLAIVILITGAIIAARTSLRLYRPQDLHEIKRGIFF